NDMNRRYFLFWESFGNFYQHIGNSEYRLHGVWTEISHILGNNKPYLRGYLNKINRDDLRIRLDNATKDVVTIRTNVVHHMREFHSILDNKYYILVPVE